jgi:YD repeat-containing protein
MVFRRGTNRVTTSDFSYDAAGNLLADGTGTGTFSFQWDAEGRMQQATDNGSGTTTTFVYNAFGQRVEKTVGASVLATAFDAFGQEIGWHTGSSWAQYFVPMPGGATPLAKYESGTVHFLHRDALGSTRFLTNHLGAVRQDALYYPWGQVWEWRVGDYDTRFAGGAYIARFAMCAVKGDDP